MAVLPWLTKERIWLEATWIRSWLCSISASAQFFAMLNSCSRWFHGSLEDTILIMFKGELWLVEILLQIMWKIYLNTMQKNFAWKFLTVTEKSQQYQNDFTQLWRQWPRLSQIKFCLTLKLVKSLKLNVKISQTSFRYWLNPYEFGWILTLSNSVTWLLTL